MRVLEIFLLVTAITIIGIIGYTTLNNRINRTKRRVLKLVVYNTTQKLFKTTNQKSLVKKTKRGMHTIQTAQRIPKIIHQFWTGSKTPPVELLKRCRRLHPTWKYMLWTDNNISSVKLENQKIYNCESNVGKSDIFRYEVLFKYGGIYLDADIFCRRPLDDFLNKTFLVAYQHYHNPGVRGTHRYEDKFIANGVLGAIPKHNMIKKIIKTLDNDPRRCKGPPWKQVGPKVVTDALKGTEIEILPFQIFYPYHFTEKIDKEFKKAIKYNSYALNLWGTTLGWKKINSLKSRPQPSPKRLQKVNKKRVQLVKNSLCKKYPNFWQDKKLEQKFKDILIHVDKTLRSASIDYSIAFGTALGYKRHQQLIPWDDDVDILIKKSTSSVAQSLIKPPYCTHKFWGGWKVFHCNSPNAGKYPWKYPFIDIFDTGDSKRLKGSGRNELIFPSNEISMHGMTLRGPKQLDKHLLTKYGTNYLEDCISPHWDHANEKGKKRETYKCKDVMKQCFHTTRAK